MNASDLDDILSRLKPLRHDTGDLVAEAIAPIDEVIAEVGVSLRASHYAEDCRDWPGGSGYYQAHASRFVFALESAEGRATEYCLCAAPGPDGRHCLQVSICEYHTVDGEREGPGGTREPNPRIEIDRIYTVRPESLSLGLRAQMLDELEQGHFLRALAAHVRDHDGSPPPEAVVRYWMPKAGTP
jgi:hypothetical protein